jgi:hypothetical protein
VNGRHQRRIPTLSVTDTDGRFAVGRRSEEINAVYVRRHTQYGDANHERQLISMVFNL